MLLRYSDLETTQKRALTLLAMAERPVPRESFIKWMEIEDGNEEQLSELEDALSFFRWEMPPEERDELAAQEIADWMILREEDILGREPRKDADGLATELKKEWDERRRGWRGKTAELFWMPERAKHEIIAEIDPHSVESAMLQESLLEEIIRELEDPEVRMTLREHYEQETGREWDLGPNSRR